MLEGHRMPALDWQWMTHVDGATLAEGDGDAEALDADRFTAVGNTPGRRFLKTGALSSAIIATSRSLGGSNGLTVYPKL